VNTKIVKIVIFFGILAAAAFSHASFVAASEGTAELRSTTQDNYRCYVASLQMQDYKYRVLVGCRNLIYPADENIFNYVFWGVDNENGEQFKFGTLGLGKASFNVSRNFTTLFVTTERNSKTKTPTGAVVMQGRMEPITFLQISTTPTPTIEGEEPTLIEEEVETATGEQTTTRERLLLGLRRAGIVSLLALVAIIGLVFVITRSRG
jgi:hypothetical protein